MEQAARNYVRRVVLIHLALLAVVVAATLLDARSAYRHSHEQVLGEARTRHELIARQTSRAIDRLRVMAPELIQLMNDNAEVTA